MKKILVILFVWLFSSIWLSVYAINCSMYDWASLRAEDWTYLWFIWSPFWADSIANQFWDYWSKFQANSIFNQFWNYWSKFSDQSPWNKFTTTPPYIFFSDWSYQRLTVNNFVPYGINPFYVLTCAIELSDDRYEPYMDLYPSSSAWLNTYTTTVTYTQTELCQQEFWSNATAWTEEWFCMCKIWYKWNSAWTSCIKMSADESCQLQYGNNSEEWTKEWTCMCKKWYERNSAWTSCIKMSKSSANESCKKSYWPNSEALSTDLTRCVCSDWYEWNYNNNWCVADRNSKSYWWKDFRSAKDWWDYINMLLDFEWEIEQKSKTENNTTTNFEKTYTRKSDELKDAIQWMYDNWLTMWNTLPEFLPYDNITREQASKFFVEFAAKVLWKDRWVVYNYDIFSDIKNANPTLKDHIIYANNMWLFKGNNWKFMPFNNLTKAQAIAVLIRLVDWMLDESWTIPYYDVNWDYSPHYWWYMQYLWHTTFYKIDKWNITSNIDKLDSDNINRWDLAILLYEMAMYLSNQDNARL